MNLGTIRAERGLYHRNPGAGDLLVLRVSQVQELVEPSYVLGGSRKDEVVHQSLAPLIPINDPIVPIYANLRHIGVS
jgi:hypothetical protein